MKVSIPMMRPNKKGNRGAKVARMMNNPKNRNHSRLLQQCEKAQSRRRSGDELV